MRCYYENYGEDIDGNRGQLILNCEITDEDTEIIVDELYDLFLCGEEGEQEIYLYCHKTDDLEPVLVDIEDYLEELIEKAESDEDIKEDCELQEYIQEVKLQLLSNN